MYINYPLMWGFTPPFLRFSQRFYTVHHTLCSLPAPLSQWEEDGKEVILNVFTSSTEKEDYSLEVTPVEDASLR